MPASARKSELQALNYILRRAGEQPVNSLDDEDALPRTAARALEILRDVSDEIQEDPDFWHITTELNKTLSPDPLDSDRIAVATNVVSISRNKLSRYANQELALRGTYVYNITDATYVFSNDIKVDQRVMLEWDNLNPQMRRYIMTLASNEYQESFVKDTSRRIIDAEKVLEARSKAIASEIREQNLSMLNKPRTQRDSNRYI